MLGVSGALNKGLIAARFLAAVKESNANSILSKVALDTTLDKETTILEGVGMPMALVEFLGDSAFQDLAKYKIEIASKRYQGGFEYDEDTPNDRIWAVVQPMIQALGINATNHAIAILSALVVAGTSGLCYDGLAFYSAAHLVAKSGSQSNLLTGNGVASLAAITKDFWLAIGALKAMLSDAGDPIYRNDMRVIVQTPLALEVNFQTIAKAGLVDGTTNILTSSFDIWADPGLSDVVDWYVHVTNEPAKPFIYGNFARPKTKFFNDDKRYKNCISASVHHGVAYGDYRQSIKVNN